MMVQDTDDGFSPSLSPAAPAPVGREVISSPLVLGGGIAAAVRLALQGMRPLLIESRPYLGGRARSFIHRNTGDEIDNGQHLMMGCYHATFALLEQLGTRDLVDLQPALRVEFREPGGARAVLAAPGFLPSQLGVMAAMLRLGGLSGRERRALLAVGVNVRLKTPGPDETTRQYLNRLGQSPRAQERLWDPIIIATLNTPPQRASARLFAEVMRRAFLGPGTDSQLAFPRTGLSQLIDPAREFIESRGGRVMTGMTITGLHRLPESYLVKLKDHPEIETGHVIAALPWRQLRPLLHGITAYEQEHTTAKPEYIPIVSIYLWYDRNPAELPVFAAMLGTQVQWMFNRRKMGTPPNPAFPGLIACTISAAFSQSAATGKEVAEMADRELRETFPELRDARLLDALVIKEKHATFAATPAVAQGRPGTRTGPSSPGYYLAGDWTDTGLPATIEGAAQSGFAAADALLEDLAR